MNATLIFNLLDELRKSTPDVLQNALHGIYSVFKKMEPDHIMPYKFEFYSREQLLDKYRTYLVNIIKDDVSSEWKHLAIRLIIIIGTLRQSGEDYLTAFNLIRDFNLTVNLDSELSQIRDIQQEDSQENDEATFEIDHKGSRKFNPIFSKAQQISSLNEKPITFDEKYWYLHYENRLYKFGAKSTFITKPGILYVEKTDDYISSQLSILFLNNKLYIRNPYSDKCRPFAVYNPATLNEIENDDLAQKYSDCENKEIQSWNDRKLECSSSEKLEEALKKNDFDIYRVLKETPLFTDGDYIYVIAKYVKNEEGKPKYSESHVEMYDPETWECKGHIPLIMEPEKQNELTLEQASAIKKETSDIIEKFSSSNIQKGTFATNGKQLAACFNNKFTFFDLDTGRRLPMVLNSYRDINGYDYKTNTFWYNDTNHNDEIILQSFKIKGFMGKEEVKSDSKTDFNKLLSARVKDITEKSNPDKMPPRSMKLYFDSLSSNSIDWQEETKTTQNNGISLSQFLIMNVLSKGCDEFDQVYNEIEMSEEKNEPLVLLQSELFRSNHSIWLTRNFILELIHSLEYFWQFLKDDMTDANILEQYQFLSISKLVNRFIKAMRMCELDLPQIVQDPDIRTKLITILNDLASKVISLWEDKSHMKGDADKDEMQALWSNWETEWKNIQITSTTIISVNNTYLLDQIGILLKNLINGNETISDMALFQFMQDKGHIIDIFKENKQELIEDLFQIFEILWNWKVEKLVNAINSLELSSEYQELEYTYAELVYTNFIRTFSNDVLSHVLSFYTSTYNKTHGENIDQDEEFRTTVELNMKLYLRVFEKLTSSTQKIFDTAYKSASKVINEINDLNLEDEEIIKTTKAQIKSYYQYLFVIAKDYNKFLDMIEVYLACYSSDQFHIMTKDLYSVSEMVISIIKSFNDYCTIELKQIECDEEDNFLKYNLSQNTMKFLIWSLSKISHSLIKVDQSDTKQDEVHENLLKSKLFSGGIESRFISTFSKETCENITILATVTNDDQLIQYLTKIEESEEDKIYDAIIHQGKDESVDQLLDLLQWNLMRKNPVAKVGGVEGAIIARCAFASMLALNQNSESNNCTNFIMMVDQLQMSLDTVEGETQDQKNKVLMQELESLGNINSIIDAWKMASKMRIWLQEKRKDISNSVNEKVELEESK